MVPKNQHVLAAAVRQRWEPGAGEEAAAYAHWFWPPIPDMVAL